MIQLAILKPVPNYLVIFEVKPLNSQTSLDDLTWKIFKIQIDGIFWRSEYQNIAYGTEKLVIGAEFDQRFFSTNDIKDKIKGLKNDVKSVKILRVIKI